MYIEYIKIENFRNLDNIEIHFHPEINFIVGENDLGKSNFLDLLNILFNKTSFDENDFRDIRKDIKITLDIHINDDEIGIFDDCIDTQNGETVKLCISQSSYDDRFKILCNNDEYNVNINSLKCVNFIRYSPIRKPEDDFNIASNKGISKVFKYFIEKVVRKNNPSLLNKDEIEKIVDSLNAIFYNIPISKKYKLTVENNPVELVSRTLKIIDDKDLDIFKSGHGFQFSLILFLYILERLTQLTGNNKRIHCSFGNSDNKSFSLILGLDEPEIHLHPFMQRQLIIELKKVIKNENNDFKTILKEIFSEDNEEINIQINGQIFVITHSPYILTDDIKHYIRFFKKDGDTKVISGKEIHLDEIEYKHFLSQIKNIKESFFSRCCLIVEGNMEFGIFPYFLDRISKMHRNLEKNKEAIYIVNAGGKNNVSHLVKVFNFFCIPSVVVADRDYKYEDNKKIKEKVKNLFFTRYKDFEEELINKLFDLNKVNLLIDFILDVDDEKENRSLKKNKLEEIRDGYRLDVEIRGDIKLKDLRIVPNKNLQKLWLLTWFNINKSVHTAQLLGDYLFNKREGGWEYIPEVYFKVIYLSLIKTNHE